VPYDPAERKELQTRYDFTRGDIEVPELKLPWTTFWVDADGRLWISRNAAAEKMTDAEVQRCLPGGPALPGMPTGPIPPISWKQPAVYDVIEPTGRFLGSVTVPENSFAPFGCDTVELSFARGTTLWTIEKGEFNERYVARYRIIPGP
jgi:hypothetical protein